MQRTILVIRRSSILTGIRRFERPFTALQSRTAMCSRSWAHLMASNLHPWIMLLCLQRGWWTSLT